MERRCELTRKTLETEVSVILELEGKGEYKLETGIPFFDHMLAQLARHGGLNLTIQAKGDLEVDAHHTVEDVGIVLGQALKRVLGNYQGIIRYGSALTPMDDALSRVVVDLSGRAYLYTDISLKSSMLGQFSTELVEEFLRAFTFNSGMTLHVELLHGFNTHHQIESIFKALGQSLKIACTLTDSAQILSTKGVF